MSGQSIMDRMAAAKHSIAGQGLAKSVCKATTEEIIGPKKKHLDYLLQCTNEPNVSIPQLADLLIERTQHSNWVVVFKSLITIHNLVNYGNERFTQYLASNNCSFNLSGFVDKAGVQGYDMSTFIRRYAKYMNEKAVSYRQMAFDFCKVKRGKDDGLLRTMNAEKLLKALPVLQAQLDALLEFDCTPNELTNGVINAAFMLLFKDLIRLFACYNDGVINLLEKYFDMNKKQCKDALDLYKKFLVRMEKVSEFLKVAENVGIDKGDIPDLAKGLKNQSSSAPASLLEALEQHLASLEGKKGGAAPVTSSAKPAGFSSALNTMTTNSSAFNISETEKKKILEEESRYLQQLKPTDSEPTAAEPGLDLLASEADDTSVVNAEAGVKEEGDEAYLEETAGLREGLELIEQRLKELTGTPASANNPFASSASPPASSPTAAAPAANAGARPSDDLLGLNNNPFADNVQSVMASAYNSQPPAPAASNNPFGAPAPAFQQQQTNGFAAGASSGNNFTSDADFARAFNSSSTASPAGMSFGTPTVSAIPNAPPALDLGSPLDPLEPTTPQRSSGFGTVEPPPLSLSQPAELLGQAPSPCPSPVPPPASPSQPMAIPGAFGGGGGMSGLGGLSSSPMPGGLSSSPMAGGMSSSPMAGGLSSSPMAGGLSSSPMGGGGGGFSSMGAGFSSSPMHGGYSSSPMGGGGFSAMGEGFSSSPMGGGYSSSPMGGGLASSPMPGGMSSNPMSAFSSGFGSQSGGMGMGMSGGGGPFSQLGVGQGSMGLSSSPTGPPGLADLHIPSSPARHLSRSPSPTMPDAGSFGRSSPCPGMGVEQHPPSASATGFDAFGDVLQPANAGGTVQGPGMTKAPEPKLLASDLDTSLASLASNLSVKSPADQVKKTSHQWQPKGESKLTGGNTYQQRPVIQSSATTWSTPQQPQFQPGMQPQMMGAPGMGFGQPQMVGAMGPQPMMGMGPGMGMGQMRPGMGGMPAMGMQQPMMYGGMGGMPAARMPQQQGQGQNPHNDPFGAL